MMPTEQRMFQNRNQIETKGQFQNGTCWNLLEPVGTCWSKVYKDLSFVKT